MEIMTSERFSFYVSDEAKQRANESNKKRELLEKRIKELTPLSPDGSGETGKYSPEASRWFGHPTYVTESKTYFHWNDNLKKGKVIPQQVVPKDLR